MIVVSDMFRLLVACIKAARNGDLFGVSSPRLAELSPRRAIQAGNLSEGAW